MTPRTPLRLALPAAMLATALAGCGRSQPEKQLTFEHLDDTSSVGSGPAILESLEPSRMANGAVRVHRPAKKSDIDALVDLSLRAYRVSSAEARREFFTDHPRFGLRDVRVLELEGVVVAALVLYPLHAFVRGAKLPVTGIGSVAVSP